MIRIGRLHHRLRRGRLLHRHHRRGQQRQGQKLTILKSTRSSPRNPFYHHRDASLAAATAPVLPRVYALLVPLLISLMMKNLACHVPHFQTSASTEHCLACDPGLRAPLLDLAASTLACLWATVGWLWPALLAPSPMPSPSPTPSPSHALSPLLCDLSPTPSPLSPLLLPGLCTGMRSAKQHSISRVSAVLRQTDA